MTGIRPVVTLPEPPEWQRVILARIRERPTESVEQRAGALGVSPKWLAWVEGCDAFRALRAREGGGVEGTNGSSESPVPPPPPGLDSVAVLCSPPKEAPSPTSLDRGQGTPLDSFLSPAHFGSPQGHPIRQIAESERRGSATGASLAQMSWSHDAIVDYIIGHPGVTTRELGLIFGFSYKWMTKLLASDAFRIRLAERKAVLIDPTLAATIEEQFAGLLAASQDVLHDKMSNGDARVAGKVLDVAGRFFAGVRASQGMNVNVNNYVAVVPAKAQDASTWAKAHGPQAAKPVTIDQDG